VSRKTFHSRIVVDDPRPWSWLHRRLSLSSEVLLAVYRAYRFYGICRIFGWVSGRASTTRAEVSKWST